MLPLEARVQLARPSLPQTVGELTDLGPVFDASPFSPEGKVGERADWAEPRLPTNWWFGLVVWGTPAPAPPSHQTRESNERPWAQVQPLGPRVLVSLPRSGGQQKPPCLTLRSSRSRDSSGQMRIQRPLEAWYTEIPEVLNYCTLRRLDSHFTHSFFFFFFLRRI